MKKIMYCSLLVLLFACKATSKMSSTSQKSSTDIGDYGYSEKNSIKVGGGTQGPVAERAYLNSLLGPNGEPIWFERAGSCCAFETPNGLFGKGMLDAYKVTYRGKGDTVLLYLNMYDKDKLLAPKGFKMK